MERYVEALNRAKVCGDNDCVDCKYCYICDEDRKGWYGTLKELVDNYSLSLLSNEELKLIIKCLNKEIREVNISLEDLAANIFDEEDNQHFNEVNKYYANLLLIREKLISNKSALSRNNQSELDLINKKVLELNKQISQLHKEAFEYGEIDRNYIEKKLEDLCNELKIFSAIREKLIAFDKQ